MARPWVSASRLRPVRRGDLHWHTVNAAVSAYGEALLDADTDRIGDVRAVGLGETLMIQVVPITTSSSPTK
jgi:hypothetical protein